jgi:dipeptidyl aminopeptidase/acylaminoacyl peptidase
MKRRRRRQLSLAVMIAITAIAVGTAGWVYWSQHPSRPPKMVAPTATMPTPPADPLTIEAIRARSYPGGAVVVEQDLGSQGGYHNYVISYPSDGFKVYALMSQPSTAAPAGGYPVVILAHGYIDPSLYRTTGPEYTQFIATLARAGFLVIKPDYRGHGSSQGVAEGGHYSPVYAYDMLNLLASLKTIPVANAQRVGLIGHSLGGHVALRTIVATSQVKATALLAGVVGSMYDLYFNWPRSPIANDKPSAVVQGTVQKELADHGDPKSNPGYWNQVSAINYVKYVTGAVQIDHGDRDTVVPRMFSDHLYDALQQAGKPVEYYNYPTADHQFGDNLSRNLLLQRLVTLFKTNL